MQPPETKSVNVRHDYWWLIKRAVLSPVFKGAALGFVTLCLVLQLNHNRSSHTEALPVLAPSDASRVVFLLLDTQQESVLGLWQWKSSANPATCIANLDYQVTPPGEPLGELLDSALRQDDDRWLARHARRLTTNCEPEGWDRDAPVLFTTKEGLIALVDALEGILVEGRLLKGQEVWSYLVESPAGEKDSRQKARQVWAGLIDEIRAAESITSLYSQSDSSFWSAPGDEDALSWLELIKPVSYAEANL